MNDKIIEGNKLIAEFMEFDVKNSVELFIPEHERHVEFKTTNGTFVSAIFKFNELNYHSSWDWLIPVVEKIEKTTAWVNIKGCAVNISTIVETAAATKMDAVWLSVVEFIKWYNKQK